MMMRYCFFRDRLNLCNLWKSIVLNEQEAIKLYARKLGVQGVLNTLSFLLRLYHY